MEELKISGRGCLPVKKVIELQLLLASVAVFGVDLALCLLYNFALWLLPVWILTGVLALICLTVALLLRRTYVQMEITDRRIVLRNAYDKRFELPLSAVNGVGCSSLFHRVIVTTATGSFTCAYQENYQELAAVISAYLLEREGCDTPLSLLVQDEEAVPAAETAEVKSEVAE